MDRSVVDAGFAPGAAPRIGDRLQVGELALEVVAHRGGGVVRAIALGSTDGLRRGAEVTDTGQPLLVPVGAASLGRVLGPTGAVTDGLGPIDLPGAAGAVRRPIHGPPPPFAEVSGAVERLETG
ncbi:MAG: F0F1 ATP synthase subunit beta, partial [Myxococcota bacterium]